ncbi:MAG: AMP-binding protein [Deltaproteobacteria bacterium]|nr:AMP-binding protein [Deltaproteobacteria bacterium]
MEGVVRWPREFEDEYRRRGYWQDVAFGEHLDRVVEAYADRAALAYDGRDISYREMGEGVDRIACLLAELGVNTYDRVVMQLFNVPELVYVFYACLKIGAIPICSLPTHRSAEIGFLARETQARVHVIPGGEVKGFDYDEFAVVMRKEAPSLEFLLTLGEPKQPGAASLRRSLERPLDQGTVRGRLSRFSPDPAEPVVFQLSGGTTGTPKLIPRTHNDYYYNAKAVAAALGLTQDDRVLIPMPLMHNGPIVNGLLPCHLLGACCVLTESFSPESILRAISSSRVTILGSVVVLMYRMLECPKELREKYDLGSVRLIWWSGNIPPEDQLKLKEMFGGCDLGQNYGMAEGLICLTRSSDPMETKMGTVGRPVSEGDEVRLMDVDTGREVAVGEVGELWCRGPYTIRGYYKAPERNLEAFSPDGFYKTGDLARKDAQGNYAWAGRVKDCISRGGEKINAEEVEVCIRSFRKVREVAVVAMPDRTLEERVCAFVVPHEGVKMSLEELNAFLVTHSGIAGFKVPERLELVPELPTTKVGKVDKKALRARIAETLKAEAKG